MKIIQKLVILFAVFAGSFMVKGQDCAMYIPVKEGTKMEIQHFNGKGKLESTTNQKILKKKGDSKNMSVDVEVKSFNNKGKEDFSKVVTFQCKNGSFVMDLSGFMPDMGKQMEGMEIKVEGAEVVIPAVLKVGQKLQDAEIKMSLVSQGMTMMSFNISIVNRKVEAYEKVTTPAGTFECYKISQDVETKGVFKTKIHNIDWMSLNVGMVKQETYDEKNNKTGYSLLTVFTN